MIRIFSLIFISSFLFGANSPWVNELSRLDNRLEKEYKKKYRLDMIGVGGGGVQGFHRYSPQFKQYSPTTKDEARELILTLAEDILHKVNNNKVLVEGMVKYPFSTENLGLNIFYSKPDGHFVNEGEIYATGFFHDNIYYSLKQYKIAPSKRLYEPLKEALEKVKGSQERFPYLWECTHPKEAEQGQ